MENVYNLKNCKFKFTKIRKLKKLTILISIRCINTIVLRFIFVCFLYGIERTLKYNRINENRCKQFFAEIYLIPVLFFFF